MLEAYLDALQRGGASFNVPGHKGRGAALDGRLAATTGDLALYGGVDTVKLSGGYLAAAEALAADRYGVPWCRFSTGGSTQGNQALCLAVAQPGDVVIVNRSVHRSLLLGLVLAGLDPRWLPTRIDAATGLPIGTAVEDLRAANDEAPEATAVFLTEPGYLGTLSDLPALIEVAHQAGLPVLVDQAWGAHFGYHPDLPAHALELGADALVTSVHKLLPGYSQASLVCARFDRLERGRLERGFEATHTTSPGGAILASIDGARALMADRGVELLERTLALVRSARRHLAAAVPGLGLPDESSLAHLGPQRFDPTRLVIQLGPIGADGIALEKSLLQKDVSLELADRDTLLPVVTVVDDEGSLTLLQRSLVEAIGATGTGAPRPLVAAMSWRAHPERVVSPRAAFFAPHERVRAEAAIGRVSAELIAPYPPGIPVLAPGELVTAELLEGLRTEAASGVRIAYATDPTLRTIEVVAKF